jgi:transcriptional regulator with XRE-family HTH domain
MEKQIQKRIRMYRKERGLTLRELAERAGCTHSYISQVEKGMTVPSLSMVGKLASAFQISVVDLFNEVPNGAEISWHLAKKDRRTINYPDGKVTSQVLVSKIATKKMEPLISRIKPGGRSDGSEEMNHPAGTEEFVLVMKGEIDFEINGKEIHLQEGDTLNFDGTLSHRWVNNGNETAEVLFIFSPPIW